MKEEKLNTEDGSQFTVFYLGDQDEKGTEHHPLCPHAVSPLSWLGSSSISVGDAFENAILKESKMELLKVEIDDTIESDFVKDPICGRIYKVKSLDKIVARLKEIVGYDSNLNPDVVYARMDLHGTEFLVAAEDLLKATENEVEKYLEKSVDK